jgi:hypothetical protein
VTEEVQRRLLGFAARFHIPPAQVWALPIDEWLLLAVGLDRTIAEERAAAAKAGVSV